MMRAVTGTVTRQHPFRFLAIVKTVARLGAAVVLIIVYGQKFSYIMPKDSHPSPLSS